MWLSAQYLLSPLAFQIIYILFQIDFRNNAIVPNADELYSEQSQFLELTSEEKSRIEELRQLMRDELQLDFEKCDDFLARWLQECDMELICASERLRKTLKWRRSVLEDLMQPNKTFLSSKQNPTLVQGRTKDDGPIMIIFSAGFDLRKLILTGHKEDLLNSQVQFIEKYFQESIRRKEDGEIRLIPGITVVNVYGFNLKQHGCAGCLSFYHDLAMICNDYYPRLTKLTVTINGPTFARPILGILRSFLSEQLQKSFTIFGSDKEEWSSFLFKQITKENLLEEFGGTMLKK